LVCTRPSTTVARKSGGEPLDEPTLERGAVGVPRRRDELQDGAHYDGVVFDVQDDAGDRRLRGRLDRVGIVAAAVAQRDTEERHAG
jgi:hypothetical protein